MYIADHLGPLNSVERWKKASSEEGNLKTDGNVFNFRQTWKIYFEVESTFPRLYFNLACKQVIAVNKRLKKQQVEVPQHILW